MLLFEISAATFATGAGETTALLFAFDRSNWKASKPAAITASAIVIPTSFRPVLRVIDSLGKTSSARLIPSGVSSNAHASTSAIGKPSATKTTSVCTTHSGA
jgi:hypothetical protein